MSLLVSGLGTFQEEVCDAAAADPLVNGVTGHDTRDSREFFAVEYDMILNKVRQEERQSYNQIMNSQQTSYTLPLRESNGASGLGSSENASVRYREYTVNNIW